MKKEEERSSSNDEIGIPYDQFPGIIELMEIQEKLHEQGKKQEETQISLSQTYQPSVVKPSLAILILFFISRVSFTQNSNYVVSPAPEDGATTGIKVGIIFIFIFMIGWFFIYKVLSNAKQS